MKSFLSLLTCAALFTASLPIHAGPLEDQAARKKLDARNAINVLRVASATQDGETVTFGGQVFEVDTTSASGITAGNVRVNLSGGSTATAVGTLTSSGNFTDTQTVTIGSKVYTFQTTLTNVDGNVLIGADRTASHANLKAAINLEAGAGTTYATAMTLHPTVTATSATATTTVVAAKIPGTVGNAIATTETQTNASWGGSTLASGVDPTAGETTTALNTAINAVNVAGFDFASTRVGANEILVTKRTAGNYVGAATETLAGSNNAWASATFYGGANTPALDRTVSVQSRVPNATEVAVGNAHFAFPFTPTVANAVVRVTSTGVVKAWDGGVTITGSRVTLDNTGSTDWAATDTVIVTAGN